MDAFFGDGHGGFTLAPAGFIPQLADKGPSGVKTSAPFQAMVLQVADLNGDGHPELIEGVQNALALTQDMARESRIFWNTGTGYGSTYTALPLPAASVFAATGHDIKNIDVDRVRVGDINGDGRPDIILKLVDNSANGGPD